MWQREKENRVEVKSERPRGKNHSERERRQNKDITTIASIIVLAKYKKKREKL